MLAAAWHCPEQAVGSKTVMVASSLLISEEADSPVGLLCIIQCTQRAQYFTTVYLVTACGCSPDLSCGSGLMLTVAASAGRDLYSALRNHPDTMRWERLGRKVALDVALGINYLHTRLGQLPYPTQCLILRPCVLHTASACHISSVSSIYID